MKTTICLSLTLMLLAGCSVASCSTAQELKNMSDSGFDFTRDAQGNKIIADTPRMWRDFTEGVDRSIANEVAGINRNGGRTWNEAWLSTIRYNQTGREHPQKYIDYIIERRRKAGLPELVDYQ